MLKFGHATVQRHRIIGDVVRLLHLQEACDDMAAELAQNGSLSWRLSLAMELMASPSLLMIDGAHPSKARYQRVLRGFEKARH